MQRLISAAFLFASTVTPAVAQQGPDILQIFDQFAISNVVASKCTKPEGGKLAKFLVNFQAVSMQTAVRIQQMAPNMTPERTDQAMKDRYTLADKNVAAVIAQETCDGPRVKEALKRFDVQASMNLAVPPAPK